MIRLILMCGIALAASGCATSPDCPSPVDVTNQQMLGAWHAEIRGQTQGTLVLEQHPIYAEGFRGTLDRGGVKLQVAGDIDGGDFTLEESVDGEKISATWIGEIGESSCGREVRGTWQAEGDALATPFTLRKMEGGSPANRR